tara:strand:+ start:406 stop:609 length:204 start_codon:yes stop_codon:yes gene_type:complete
MKGLRGTRASRKDVADAKGHRGKGGKGRGGGDKTPQRVKIPKRQHIHDVDSQFGRQRHGAQMGSADI